MKSGIFLSISALVLAAIAGANSRQSAPAQDTSKRADRTPVIVELFTSEGCSTCPPADALLKKLETDQPITGAEVIGLEEHVDYWNHDGWVDPFSGAEWTYRQQQYVDKFKGKTPYTPEMIVDGEKEFVGNSGRDALETIRQATKLEKAQVSIATETTAKSDTQRVEVRVGNLPATSEQDRADVWVAVTEQGLQTSVKAGENKDRTWEHAAIVRSLQKIGSLPSKGSEPFVANPQIKLKSSWKKENLRIVVFVQERKSWRILGAASAKVA
jgi:hypothetical protein